MNKVYCPLAVFKLNWKIKKDLEEIRISDEIKIIKKKDVPDLDILSDNLSPSTLEQNKQQVNYWLKLKGDYNYKEFKELIQIFQLTIWIVKPTETFVSFVSDFNEDFTRRKFTYFLYRFGYINNHQQYEYNIDDLKSIKLFYPILKKLYQQKRFKASLVFNFNGCISSFWESAYILFTTTFESLLSYNERGVQLSNRLAFAYAIIMEREDNLRMKEFNNFKKMYKIRSKILHGYSFKFNTNSKENLSSLADCRDMLRDLWMKILNSQELIDVLSKKDNERKKYFKRKSNNWRPEIKLENII